MSKNLKKNDLVNLFALFKYSNLRSVLLSMSVRPSGPSHLQHGSASLGSLLKQPIKITSPSIYVCPCVHLLYGALFSQIYLFFCSVAQVASYLDKETEDHHKQPGLQRILQSVSYSVSDQVTKAWTAGKDYDTPCDRGKPIGICINMKCHGYVS